MEPTALAGKLFEDITGALRMYAVYLGERLGYYRALAEGGPMTSAELAERTGTHERYTREWLEHQASCGLLTVDGARVFTLPAEHVPVLADRDHVLYGTQPTIDLVRVARRLAELVDVYRTGEAPSPIPWEPEGRSTSNRATFLNLLGREWLPAIPDVHKRLSEGGARVADIACGLGWSSIAMALAYPLITVDGLDLDTKAIEAARRNARESGVAGRVTFSAMDAAELTSADPYDVVIIIEALHDMTHPVDTLRTARGLLAPGGTVLVVDTKPGEEFTAPGPLVEQFEYGWSLVACLPATMGDPASAMTGTVMRPATMRKYAEEAGFSDVSILPIESDTWRFYRLG
ncbi:bifunctional 2-polyprenyl-6-hydroxyphenol methylase/3-demethylubiquinol 3-O-methyltransferase UbiG [Kibdelosporangium persicum]|uniref:S-adenosylmethionine-dependent methyltransferase n=1 Tax=Kibdelosporangium persicum TaxID=2698649 RepID=A0ABX2EVV0_9PSEU|nr:class I SAM-dependent methyltransferase [Kibdelosporangium persicum]NRN63161.1 S-adenosylmethionine-dependent methyltransferase [Kibdelosporangium persicum]